MNRIRNSIKGARAPSPNTEPAESELMASQGERRPVPELDLQLVSDDARSQFAEILVRVEGKKDIVIQEELLSLLDHVTPIGFLKK